jgi:hypothetical protein
MCTDHNIFSKNKMNVTDGKKLTSPDIFSLYALLQSSEDVMLNARC